MLKKLDILEQYPRIYDREEIVFTDDTTAWIYFMKDEHYCNDSPKIKCNDWIKYVITKRRYILLPFNI